MLVVELLVPAQRLVGLVIPLMLVVMVGLAPGQTLVEVVQELVQQEQGTTQPEHQPLQEVLLKRNMVVLVVMVLHQTLPMEQMVQYMAVEVVEQPIMEHQE